MASSAWESVRLDVLEIDHDRRIDQAAVVTSLRYAEPHPDRGSRRYRRGIAANQMLGAPPKAPTAASAETNLRRRSGASSPTGTPLRVTTKLCPRSRARMISPLSLRNSRWLISPCHDPKCSTLCCMSIVVSATQWHSRRRESGSGATCSEWQDLEERRDQQRRSGLPGLRGNELRLSRPLQRRARREI